jgi:MFS family permease
MKLRSKLIFILFLLLCVFSAFAQSNNSNDDEFNLFLLSLLAIFFCAMIGAAIIGAMVAALVLFFLLALITAGVLSTSVMIGLYKRSFEAGFKSFLMILFAVSCAVIGCIGSYLSKYFLDLHMSTAAIIIIGIAGGLIGGLIMAVATYQVFRWVIKKVTQKLRLV